MSRVQTVDITPGTYRVAWAGDFVSPDMVLAGTTVCDRNGHKLRCIARAPRERPHDLYKCKTCGVVVDPYLEDILRIKA